MLAALGPELQGDRETWFKVGCALRGVVVGVAQDKLYRLWRDWSAASSRNGWTNGTMWSRASAGTV